MRAPALFSSRLYFSAILLAFALVLAGCGDAFVTGPPTGGGSGGSGGAPMGGGGSSSQGGQGAGTSGSGGDACSAPAATELCDVCLFDACKEQFCECAGNEACVALRACRKGGGPEEYCWQQHQGGIADEGSLGACGSVACSEDCPYKAVAPCRACQFEKCAEEVNACYSKPDCLGYLQCFAECMMMTGDELGCSNTCYGEHMSGSSPAKDLAMCASSQCSDACM